MNANEKFSAEGGCVCGRVRYRMERRPMFVNCCHCRWCQRETGAAFALNAVLESAQLRTLGAAPELVDVPSQSGKGQRIARCPNCRIAVWSYYAAAGDAVSYIRVGTLDDPGLLPPDMHIFTDSKQPWLVLPPDIPAVGQYYNRRECWPESSLARWRAVLG